MQDRVELPPNMTFELDNLETLNLPSSKPKFIAFPDAEPTVKQFLEQYFLIYDSDNRQPLLDAYHNDCYFSVSISYTSKYILLREVEKWVKGEIFIFFQKKFPFFKNKLLL